MVEIHQPALSPELQPQSSEEIRVALNAIARHINDNAQPVVHEDRTSEAARDQGWGPTERGVPIEDEDHPTRKPEAVAAQKARNIAIAKRLKPRPDSAPLPPYYGTYRHEESENPVDPATIPARVDEILSDLGKERKHAS